MRERYFSVHICDGNGTVDLEYFLWLTTIWNTTSVLTVWKTP